MKMSQLAVVVALALGAATGCGAGAKDASSSSAELQIEYVAIAVPWVKRHVPAGGDTTDPYALSRKLGDEMLSRMQSSAEPLDAIADAAVKAVLGAEALADKKRRKAVSIPASHASQAELPPDARDALVAFAKKAKAGDVVNDPLGSGVVIVVARAVRKSAE